jgi:hypothetical protein
MNLEKDIVREIKKLIVFTAIIFLCIWKYEVVFQSIHWILDVITPWVIERREKCMNDVINPVKLKELEDKVDQFHHYMVCYKNADQNELKEQLDSLNRVILEEDQQLKQKLHYSKSEVAFRIGMAYEEVENIIRDLKKDLKRMSEASSLDEFDAEKAALLAEYMMDFAMQTSDYALLSVMKANDAQLRLEEKEA